MPNAPHAGRFHPGRLLATPAVLEEVPRDELMSAFHRHLQCDWGGVKNRNQNAQALRTGGRLFSVYQSSENRTFWIITEADRSATTILLPEDY